jgi:hypothetical protein
MLQTAFGRVMKSPEVHIAGVCTGKLLRRKVFALR